MSVHYLIDGYNVILRIPKFSKKSLEESRDSFVRFLEVHKPQGSLRNCVTVVFDGQPDIIGRTDTSFIKVVFTKGESADTAIKKFVEDAANKRNIIVVTDDNEIRFYVRSLGAKILSVIDFFDKVQNQEIKESQSKKKNKEIELKNISKTFEHQVNQELEDIWLKKKKKKYEKKEFFKIFL